MSLFVDIAALEDIPQQGARVIKTPEGGPLSEGIVHGSFVTCPLHNWVFDMTTGLAQGADDGAVRTWPVRVEAGRILITTDLIARSRAA